MSGDTYEVPSAEGAKEQAGGAAKYMLEGGTAGLGIELGGAAVPVLGEIVGGYAASLVQNREDAKAFTNRLAAFKAAEHLLA